MVLVYAPSVKYSGGCNDEDVVLPAGDKRDLGVRNGTSEESDGSLEVMLAVW